MRAVLPAHPAHIDEPQVRLVDEGRRLQRVARAFPFETTPRNLVQLAVHERNELLEGGLVAPSPGEQQCRNVVHGLRNGAIIAPGSTFPPRFAPISMRSAAPLALAIG